MEEMNEKIKELIRRSDDLGMFLAKAEELLFKASDLEGPDISLVQLMESYKEASRRQVELLEFVRKWQAQNPPKDKDEVTVLAEMLKGAGVDTLKQIRTYLMKQPLSKSSSS